MSVEAARRAMMTGNDDPDELPDRLHIGCGTEQLGDGWLDTDISGAVAPDQTLDITDTPWPFANDTFERVRGDHVLEHVADPVAVLREAARVTKPGGRVTVTVPLGVNAATDPTHRDRWTWATPEYFEQDGPYRWEAGCNLQLVERELSVHGHAPIHRLDRWLQWAAERWPLFVPDIPGVSGELTAVWEVVR